VLATKTIYRCPRRAMARAGVAILAFQISSMAHALEIKGLDGSVTALAYSPDGKTIAAADGGFELTLWDATNGKSLAKLKGLASGTTTLCWSPDGKTLYGTTGNEIISWDAPSGHEKRKLKAEMTRTGPKMIALSKDGKTLAAIGNSVVKLWNASSGDVIAEYEVHPNYSISGLAFSPDGKSIATSSSDKQGLITVIADGTGTVYTCENRVVAAEFSPDGKRLYLADEGPLLHQIDLAPGEDHPAPALVRVPKQIAVSPDSKLVACAGSSLRIWSPADNQWFEKRIEDSAVGPLSVSFSPDGKMLACGDAEGRIHVWPTKELLQKK
jgi:WD40 repeat protein